MDPISPGDAGTVGEGNPAGRDERLAQLLSELVDRAQQGDAVELDAVCHTAPDLAVELRQLWTAVVAAQTAARSSSVGVPIAPEPTGSHVADLPQRVGDYELLEEIGRGGMGVVYRAWQVSLGREVAVKMILRGELAGETDRVRFWAEAEAAARLAHENIVPVYEVGELDGEPFFSMKYVRGQTLAQRVAEGGPLPPKESASIMAQVAQAIHFAHEQGVLHRDLKPSNILLDDRGRPHVTDFGLAKQTAEAGPRTLSGSVLGTPEYMSPEQAAGARSAIGPASDVYSLGGILYFLVAGRPPFQASTAADAVLMVLEQEPVLPRTYNPRADRDLEMIAIRCLQKPIDLRYPSAASLAADLEAYLHDEPLVAHSGRLAHIVARLFRETHHAPVLENWGVLWMWHSLALFLACLLTNVLFWLGNTNRWHYFALWTAGFGTWAAVFWALRRRRGPVTFVERQIAHVWAASMVCIAALFPLEGWLGLPVLTLSPVIALISGMVFLIKAGILSGAFYIQAAVLFLTAPLMAWRKESAHLIFGVVSAACFFVPGYKYYRRGRRR